MYQNQKTFLHCFSNKIIKKNYVSFQIQMVNRTDYTEKVRKTCDNITHV